MPIKLLCVDGGILENITISDIKMDNVSGPVFIRLGSRNRPYDKPIEQVYTKSAQSEGSASGVLRNVTIKNISAVLSTTDQKRNTIFITGVPGNCVENVVLENLNVEFPGGSSQKSTVTVPEDEARYPERHFFGVAPAYGVYARHVKGLNIKNCHFKLTKADYRHALVLDDVTNLIVNKLEIPGCSKAAEAISLKSTPKAILKDIKFDGAVQPQIICVEDSISKGFTLKM